jgi:GTPase Era involved in 16S rRNA processing
MNSKEKEKARLNGFVLAGKTGAGKTTLLNAIFGKEVGRVERGLNSVTQESTVYYYKTQNGKCISLIDTPGLSDSNTLDKINIDFIHLENITEVISKENIRLKGILFLVNFQNERFDSDEQKALLRYNELFPLRRFWKNIIIIFTHNFGDPDGDSKEEMKAQRDISNGNIFSKIMEKVKNVSDVIKYDELKIKYFNSYSPTKTDKQVEKNIIVRDELEKELNLLCETEPLFSQIEIIHATNQKYEDEKTGKKYIVEYKIYGFFDLNGKKPLYEKKKIISQKEIEYEEENLPAPDINVEVIKAKKDSEDNLNLETQKGDKNNSNYLKYKGTKTGLGIGSVGGAILGGILGFAGVGSLPAIGIGLGVVAAGTLIGSFFN